MKPVTPDSIISEVLSTRPEAAAVFTRYGLGCPSCLAAGMESVSAVASMHEVSVDDLVRDLNETHAGSVGEESGND